MATPDEYEKVLTKLELGVALTDRDKDLLKKMLKETGARGSRARDLMK